MENSHILIVEDECLMADALALKLTNWGYGIRGIVSSGKAALESVKSAPPALILMDIALAGSMDGIDTAAQIGETADIPIVYLTAYADDQTVERASQTNCHGYILKPFQDRQLQATLKIALQKHQEQTEIHHLCQEALHQSSASEQSLYTDSLTQLPNRLFVRELFDYLCSKYENSAETENPPPPPAPPGTINLPGTNVNPPLLGLLYLELDRFSRLHDCLAHEHQEFLIQAVAQRLRELGEQGEGETSIARLHQSEFVLLLAGLTRRQQATALAQMVLERLHQPFLIGGQELFVTASIGLAFYPLDHLELEQLLKQAQRALKHAQQQGGNQYQFYTPALQVRGYGRLSAPLSLETDLHYALERQELALYYQPIIQLRTGQIVSTEALIRWHHPRLGLIAAAKFIELAEASGQLESIGAWAINQACHQTYQWHQAGFPQLTVALNLSGRQFQQVALFQQLTQIFFDSYLAPQFLQLELTEKILVDNVKANVQRLHLLKKLGLNLALDDFGTGYSSLSYLQQFPFDTLKIDRSFLHHLDRHPTNAIITKTIIEMAHQLKLKVVAEGLETQTELAFLLQHQCDWAQGYLFSRPLPTSEFEHLLLSRHCFPLPREKI